MDELDDIDVYDEDNMDVSNRLYLELRRRTKQTEIMWIILQVYMTYDKSPKSTELMAQYSKWFDEDNKIVPKYIGINND
ncbi:MAG: hypothetical protein DRQ39_07200 [Gammaproteobacteria bacterium]|nr:MAG: hypothetical protein DRQ39_07200 [Gammaproteobacteria bacterium]